MSKKLLDRIFLMLEKDKAEVKKVVDDFYETHFEGNLFFIHKNNFVDFSKKFKTLFPQSVTDEKMQQQCFQIQNFVKAGRTENLEIQFEKGIQRFEGRKHELMETIVKLDIQDADKPVYLYLRENERLRAIIFAGGDEMNAFLVLEDNDENICFARLMGFHMLSIPETAVPGKEIGLMTSYSYMAAQVYSGVIMGQTLNPVKNLLFSEWFQALAEKEEELKEDEKNGEEKEAESTILTEN